MKACGGCIWLLQCSNVPDTNNGAKPVSNVPDTNNGADDGSGGGRKLLLFQEVGAQAPGALQALLYLPILDFPLIAAE